MTMPAVPYEQSRPYTHVTVMPKEVTAALEPRAGGVYLDVTAGGGGHAAALLAEQPGARVLAFDRDPKAVVASRRRLAEFGDRALVLHAAFDEVAALLAERGIAAADGLVADLGISSEQLAEAERGMSFRLDGPLDMRMDPTRGETARELIERLSQDQLADVVYQYGEERRSRRVARCVKQALSDGALDTTADLRRAIVRAVGPRRVGGIDPATRTFQALRIAVNRELEQLGLLLEHSERLLAPGGVACLISFHSLEDRLVKRAFLERDRWERLSKKPLVASESEQAQNPRARSAKLRAARRVVPDRPAADSALGSGDPHAWEEFDDDS
jgi:16S rRNA (cytosine1402-N4)-methyltransferase